MTIKLLIILFFLREVCSTNWAPIGCYVDDDRRDLGLYKGHGYNQGRCATACSQYKYFALQFHGQCFCGNAYSTSAQYRKVDDRHCGSDRLGRAWRNMVYSNKLYKSWSAVGCFIDDLHRDLDIYKGSGYNQRKCATSCSLSEYFALQYHGQCFCGDAYSTSAQYRQVNVNECGKDRLGRAWRNMVYRNNLYVKTWRALGCFVDDGNRDLDIYKGIGYDQTRCASACSLYKYFALQNHGQCFCGNAYSTAAQYRKVAVKECGDDRLGRSWRNMVYGTKSWYAIGCYVDNGARDLDVYKGKRHKQASCYKSCSAYKYFALQYHGQCWCGNAYSTAAAYRKVKVSECGKDGLGRGWRNMVYGRTLGPVTHNPTQAPTKSPTNLPTVSPTRTPTRSPTHIPTRNPTDFPTTSPTPAPTVKPTTMPTQSQSPTTAPSISPTGLPTIPPTSLPTIKPTYIPTEVPTMSPTVSPTVLPTSLPSGNPTKAPTVSPTDLPTGSPTSIPTDNPTANPTKAPTVSPTDLPTVSPTNYPTDNPSNHPTSAPTMSPTDLPTVLPTRFPTRSPTSSPTQNPTTSPTASPTDIPTISPTSFPTNNPTDFPTKVPTLSPTDSPTVSPTSFPTDNPTDNPTKVPTVSPTDLPTVLPTNIPTDDPTANPTKAPTTSPTDLPTVSPTSLPTENPTKVPTMSPTELPTLSPTSLPTDNPTKVPTKSPTDLPTVSPTSIPTDLPTTIGSECNTESPPVIPNSFQKLMTLMMDPTGQSCEAANTFSNIEDKLCTGVLYRMPKFAFNLKNPKSDMFCQFLDLFPIGKVAGRSTCNAIFDCVVRNIKGKHGNLEEECGTDIFRGLAKDVEKKMSDWTNTLSGVASITNDATTSFLETVGCGKDPSSAMRESISAIVKIFKGLTNYHSQLETMFELLPEIMQINPEEFYNSLGTDDDKEKDYFSFLMGPSISIQIEKIVISKNLGVFVTVPIEVLKRCAYSAADSSKVGVCLKKMDIYEIGIYEAIGAGLTSDTGVSTGVSGGKEFLHGTSNKWGGFGFGISIGGGPKVFVAESGGEFGLVFSALESGGKQYMDEFIGFNVYINAGAGPKVPIPVTVSVSCAVAKVSTAQKCKKSEPPKCPNRSWKEMINKWKNTGEKMGQDWVDLYDTCKANWGKKWKKCDNAANNYADAFKSCGKGFTKKCVIFERDYCQQGKWKQATKTCEKYYESKGKCKIWNTKENCSNYGQKKGSCRTWNTRRYCGQFGQKKGSCRTWNTRKYCGQYGQKKKCDWVKKGTDWASVPYPCGTKWCGRSWWKHPCGVKICHKNVAKDIMGWSCKMVTDTAKCLRHVVENTSCRSWNMVKDTSRCVRHVVENTSCRSWNMVRDTSKCLRHVVVNTSCRTWDMVKDSTKCVSGWIHTAGKCMVDTVGHCSKWAGTCTKNKVISNYEMFKDCGVNMLPYIPA